MKSACRFNILIVEDELLIAEMIKTMLVKLGYQVVAHARTYDQALHFLEHLTLDLVLLDIHLGDEQGGIELGGCLNQQFQIPFIYLTSYSDFKTVQQAAVTQPEAYLLKPFTQESLFSTIELIRNKPLLEKPILLKDKGFQVSLFPSDIVYVRSENNYLDIFTETKKYTYRSSLEGFLNEMDVPFIIRTHRSYAVNERKVKGINAEQFLVDNATIPISRKYKKEIADLFQERGSSGK